MRVITSIFTFIFLLPGFATAVDPTVDESVEVTTRRLDLAEASAVLTADFDAVEKLTHDGQWLLTACHANVICAN